MPSSSASVAHFEAALEDKARCGTKSWTEVAQQFGYYDQMHMVHDFAEFTGGTPSQTLTQLETVFVEQIKALRSPDPSKAIDRSSRLIL